MRRCRPAAESAARAGRLLLLTALVAACGAPEVAVEGPEGAALRLFELARVDEPPTDRLESVIHAVPGEADRAALLDALSTLAGTADPRVLEVTWPAGPDDAFVDLEAAIPGGGSARFAARVRETGPGVWRVIWFGGPDAEWPASGAARGDGLSSSAPPESTR